MRRNGLLTLALVLTVNASAVYAHNFHIPQPWRADAVVEGRDETFNDERFLHIYSFRHSQRQPSATELGLRGTGGSVSSRRLYFDSRFRQDFGFNDDQQAFMLDIQRSWDLDGAYDRQLVGFRHQLTERTQVSLQGDVFADKSEADVYLGLRRLLNHDGWLQATWILPDTVFNDKTQTDDRIRTEPHSYFLQWHQPWADQRQQTTVSVTLSPKASIDSARSALFVESQGLRGAVTQTLGRGDWSYLFEYAGEYSRRDYLLDENDGTESDFRRQHHEWTVEARFHGHRYQPAAGVRYLHLTEQGYFGRALDSEGTVRRREPMAFVSGAVALGPRQTLRPALYAGLPKVDQNFDNEDVEDRNSEKFRAKLALPLEIALSQREPVILTLAPTFRLHNLAFGGGNLQLHWPL